MDSVDSEMMGLGDGWVRGWMGCVSLFDPWRGVKKSACCCSTMVYMAWGVPSGGWGVCMLMATV